MANLFRFRAVASALVFRPAPNIMSKETASAARAEQEQLVGHTPVISDTD
jgi:hypothetical protein